MAKISFASVVAEARGKVGGSVYSKTRSGSVVRVRVTPSNPRSAPQSGVRTYLTSASRAFKALSATNLALWKTYAGTITKHQSVSGQAYNPSGVSAFTALAAKFLQATPGGTIPTSPPTTPFAGDTVVVTAVGAAGKVTFTTATANATGVTTELLLQPLKSGNRVPNPNGYRTEAFFVGTLAGTHDVTHLAADYLHPSAPVPAGIYIPAYKFIKLATGEQSPLTVLPAVTVT